MLWRSWSLIFPHFRKLNITSNEISNNDPLTNLIFSTLYFDIHDDECVESMFDLYYGDLGT